MTAPGYLFDGKLLKTLKRVGWCVMHWWKTGRRWAVSDGDGAGCYKLYGTKRAAVRRAKMLPGIVTVVPVYAAVPPAPKRGKR